MGGEHYRNRDGLRVGGGGELLDGILIGGCAAQFSKALPYFITEDYPKFILTFKMVKIYIIFGWIKNFK